MAGNGRGSPTSWTEVDGLRPVTRHRRLLGATAAGILAVGVASSILGALAWSSYVRVQDAHAFDSTAATAASALGVALQRDTDLTATARTLVETTPALTNSEFATWFRLLGTRDSYPGSFGLLYIESVPARRLAEFERRVSTDPPLGLPASGAFVVSPRHSSPPYCLTRAGVVQVTASMHISPSLLTGLLSFAQADLDYCALPIGRALRETAATDKPAAFTLASLIASTPRLAGVPAVSPALTALLARSGLIATLTPVFPAGAVPGALSSRLDPVDGWILGIYQAGSILEPVLHGHSGWSAVLSYANPSGARTILARSGSTARDALARDFPLDASRTWAVALSAPLPSSGMSAGTQAAALFVGGLVLSLLLFFLVLVLSRSRTRALQLVEVRTAQLRHRALHDDLTELPNRALIFDRAEQMLARAHRDGTVAAALFVDLDQFKDVNDSLGHGAGDDLLREAARRFSATMRETDTVGRLGGDEFVVLVESAPGSPGPEHVASKLIAAMQEPFHLGADGLAVAVISASIGVASGILGSAEELLRDADIALYEAKATTRGGYVVFRPEMRETVAARLGLEAELREAVAQRQFFLVYQPTFDLGDQRITGAEALLRWRHPERGLIMPGEFIPALEATGMIIDVGRYVLFEACRQAAEWRRAGHELAVSVNVSARQVEREDLVEVVEDALRSAELPPDALTLEITETTLMRNTELSATRLRSLKSVGVNLAIDDFGTGYCSLAYLQQFPVDSLKIDQSFVSRMESSAEGAALVHMIVQLGKDLNLVTLAEGIETPSQLARLQLEECVAGQGYLLARPLDPGAMGELLDERRARSAGSILDGSG